jgi:hypothetical protein
MHGPDQWDPVIRTMHKRGLLSFKGKERPSREIAAVFSFEA